VPRPNAADRGYGSKWQSYRTRFLRENPFCRLCWQAKRQSRATVVDHIQPHKGDKTLFWARSNHQALCQTCHDGTKKQLEVSGTLRGCDASGVPLDPTHHWGQG
jgi:5-methylcytosine-specific restriction enzyme A